ncbi:hypothetical protein ACP70R_039207 [Stipagrostis hirtigluma subsp. patula]
MPCRYDHPSASTSLQVALIMLPRRMAPAFLRGRRVASCRGRGLAPPERAACGVAAAARGGGDGRELALGTRAGAGGGGGPRGGEARAGPDGAPLVRLGHPRPNSLRLLARELRPPQGMEEVDYLMELFEGSIRDNTDEYVRLRLLLKFSKSLAANDFVNPSAN